MLIALTVILIALILLLCGDRGAKSIVTTVIQASFLLAAIFLIYRGLPPVKARAVPPRKRMPAGRRSRHSRAAKAAPSASSSR